MIATTIGGSTIGIRKKVRANSTTRDCVCSKSASSMPSRTWNSTPQNDSFACTHSELTKRGSPGSRR
jgi:hypothetical protein